MIRLFAAHPTAAALLALALVALGLLSLPRLERDTFPDYRLERIEVRIAYPGAAAEETEASLCLAVEDALDRVTGIHRLTCTARANLAVAEIEVAHGHDTGRLLTEVKAEIDAIDTLPATAERPVVRQLDATEPVVSLALAGPMAPPALRDLAERLKTDLLDLPGVAEVTVGGFSDRQLEVALDEARLWALGLSAAAVAAAIERQSLDLPAGIVETTDRDLRLRFVDRRRTAAGLERLVLRDDATGTLRLGDVATVSERFATPELETRFNGERAAILTIRRAKGTDALRVLAAVEAHVAALAPTLPPTVTLALTDDATSLIADRLRLLVTNAAQGFALVLLVLWAFFSARFSLAVAAALPLSLLATVFVLDLLGLSLNLISMVGLLIAVGLLIDSAIVINENIARQVEAGAGPVAAAVAGVGQVQGAVLASFLTSVAVFAPLGFLAGDIGRVLVAVPIVLIIVLAASLVVSFLVLPFFTARSLASGRARSRTHPLRRRLDAGFEAFRDRVVGRLVRLAVTWRWLAVGLAAFAFTASLALLAGGTLRFQAFPDVEGDVVQARLMLAAGTPRARTEAAVDRLVAALERAEARLAPGVPDGEALVRAVTVELGRNPDTVDQGAHLATVEADLLTSARRGLRVDAILAAWRQETGPLPDLVALAFVQPALGPAGKAIAIRLAHPDLDTLVAAAAELRTALARHAGVLDVAGDLYPGMPEIRLALAEGAGRLGLDAAEVARQLRAAFQEVTADELPLGRQTLRVDVRHDLDWRRGLGRLDRNRPPRAAFCCSA